MAAILRENLPDVQGNSPMSHFDRIYLSPHLDDAALSCGGQIASLTGSGLSILIVTLMAGEPPNGGLSSFAQSHHDRWQLLADTVRHRRAEDIVACEILGAAFLHQMIPDCIYRRNPWTGEPLYNSDADLFGNIDPAEAVLEDRLAEILASLPAADEIITPLAVGNHVDHQLTRKAAERVWGDSLLYYEDYPYVREPGGLKRTLEPDRGWEPTVIILNERELQTKIEAIAAFKSQLDTFFTSLVDLNRQIRSYADRVGGERLWRKKR